MSECVGERVRVVCVRVWMWEHLSVYVPTHTHLRASIHACMSVHVTPIMLCVPSPEF